MIESAVKAKVNDLASVRNKLRAVAAEFVGTNVHSNRIYAHEKDLGDDNRIAEGGITARINRIGDKARLEFAEFVTGATGFKLNSDITDEESVAVFLNKIGFKNIYSVRRSREVFMYKDLTVCLDEVEMLGDYVAVEGMPDAGNNGKFIKTAQALLKELAPEGIIEEKSYGELMQAIIKKDKL